MNLLDIHAFQSYPQLQEIIGVRDVFWLQERRQSRSS